MNIKDIWEKVKPGTKGWIALTVLAFILFGVTNRYIESLSVFFSLLFVVMLVLAIVKRKRNPNLNFERDITASLANKPKKIEEEHLRTPKQQLLWAEELISAGELPVIDGTPIVLKNGERVHFESRSIRYITRNRVVGHTANTGSISFRLAKGVTVRSGGVKGQSIYGDVTGAFPGDFYVTNKKIIFAAYQHGFESSIGRVTAVTPGSDGKIVISTPGTDYVLHLATEFKKNGRAAVIFGVEKHLLKLLSLINSQKTGND